MPYSDTLNILSQLKEKEKHYEITTHLTLLPQLTKMAQCLEVKPTPVDHVSGPSLIRRARVAAEEGEAETWFPGRAKTITPSAVGIHCHHRPWRSLGHGRGEVKHGHPYTRRPTGFACMRGCEVKSSAPGGGTEVLCKAVDTRIHVERKKQCRAPAPRPGRPGASAPLASVTDRVWGEDGRGYPFLGCLFKDLKGGQVLLFFSLSLSWKPLPCQGP